MKDFESFLLDSFKDGRVSRELRLTPEEVDIIKTIMPNASLHESGDICGDGKSWYVVHIHSEGHHGKDVL
ncbi:hypothetical protein [Ferdinandcohnia sp. Marseille-Q9671]